MRPQKISEMFSDIAGRYDFLNKLLSFGLDSMWRKRMVELAKVNPGDYILDIATGTGDVAIEFANKYKKIQIRGVDFAKPMLVLAEKKVINLGLSKSIKFQYADALRLPFKDSKFDVVTMAFGIRNIADHSKCIREMKRVTKKGGKVLIMEFSEPNFLVRPFYLIFLRFIIPALGQILSKKSAYQYLQSSIQEFTTNIDLEYVLKSEGFSKIQKISMTFGVVSIYVGHNS